jgi:hypothetical protein
VTDLWAVATGGLLLIATIAFSAWSSALLRKTRRDGSVMDGLAQVVFLPEKRRRYLWLMSLEGSLFVLSGLVLGVVLLLGLSIAIGLVAFVLLFLGAMGFMTSRTALGLRRSELTEEQKEAVRRELPNALQGIAFIPLGGDAGAMAGPPSLYVVSIPPPSDSTTARRRARAAKRE